MSGFFSSISDFFAGDIDRVGKNGLTRLQQAIVDNDLERLNKLVVAYGADVNETGLKSQTPLIMALNRGQLHCARLLIAYGADVDRADSKNGETPLHIAAAGGYLNVVERLLLSMADPAAKDRKDNTPLHRIRGDTGHLIARALCRAGANPNAQNKTGLTPLDRHADDAKIVRVLLEHGANPNITTNPDGTVRLSPFARQLCYGTASKITRDMIEHGANPETESACGGRLIHVAAETGDSEIFRRFLYRVDIHALDGHGYSVLPYLIDSRMNEEVEMTLTRAPELGVQHGPNGLTPMEMVLTLMKDGMEEALVKIALSLIRKGGADINSKTPERADGMTLLHHAAIQENTNLVKELIGLGAGLDLNQPMANGKTAVHLATEQNNIELLDMLLDAGANPDQTDAQGWTLLDRHAAKGDRDSPIVQRLIVAGGQYRKQLPLNPSLMRPPVDANDSAPKNDNNRDTVGDKKSTLALPRFSREAAGDRQITKIVHKNNSDNAPKPPGP